VHCPEDDIVAYAFGRNIHSPHTEVQPVVVGFTIVVNAHAIPVHTNSAVGVQVFFKTFLVLHAQVQYSGVPVEYHRPEPDAADLVTSKVNGHVLVVDHPQ
jgi:hypothetical protein